MSDAGAQDPTRVLVVDDSAVARQAVARAITQAGGMQVVGLARDGLAGLEQVERVRPDVVILDLEMPRLDGYGFLREVRRHHPDLPVIVFSALSSRGAEATLAAMDAGATAYALKPGALRGSGDEDLASSLVPVVRSVTARRPRPGSGPGRSGLRRGPDPRGGPVKAVVIGVSTGGPSALNEVIGGLPATLPVPVFIVQHMPATFTALLAHRLDARCPLPVSEAVDSEVVVPGHVYLAPGGHHLTLAGSLARPRVRLTDDPPVNSCRPSADVLFRTAAAVLPAPVLGVVLTGMGADGTRGADAIVTAGGSVIAQDPATAVVGSMPQAVIAAGLADMVLPLDEIAAAITDRT